MQRPRAAIAALAIASVAVVSGRGDARAAPRPWTPPAFRSAPLRAAAARLAQRSWAEAATDLGRALARGVPRTERPPAEYMLAVARMRAGDCARAAPAFERLTSTFPVLASYAAYGAAVCHARTGQFPRALQWARKVPAEDLLAAEAALVEIEVLAMQQQRATLVSSARAFLQRHPHGPRRAEVAFRLGDALERDGRRDEAATAYRAAWRTGGTSRWATDAERRLAALEPQVPAARKRAEDWIGRGMFFFERHQNEEAERTFTHALATSTRTPAETCTARYHLAQSVWKGRARPRALPLFAEAAEDCRAAGNGDLAAKAVYQHARCLLSVGRKPEALQRFLELSEKHAAHAYADDALLRAAEVDDEIGTPDDGDARLRAVRARHPGGDMLGESLWRLAWRRYTRGDLAGAEAQLRDALTAVPREDVWYAEGRTLYWLGRVVEQRQAREEALDLYERAIREYPLSYYALLAFARLREVAPQRERTLVAQLRRGPPDATTPWTPGDLPARIDGRVVRAAELTRMGLEDDVARELASFGESWRAAQSQPAREGAAMTAQYWLAASLLDRAGIWRLSHAIPRYRLRAYRLTYPAGPTAPMWRLAYPAAFPALVRGRAEAAGIPATLVWAVMREESAFDPASVSPANCLGLTMLKLTTAQDMLGRGVTREAMFDPATNVRAGAAYLAKLIRRFGGARPLAIAAYNGGAGSVDRWLTAWPSSPLDELLERVPYEETRNYTKRVLASSLVYAWLYGPSDLPHLLGAEVRR